MNLRLVEVRARRLKLVLLVFESPLYSFDCADPLLELFILLIIGAFLLVMHFYLL
jgi:hypothetical protein